MLSDQSTEASSATLSTELPSVDHEMQSIPLASDTEPVESEVPQYSQVCPSIGAQAHPNRKNARVQA